MSKVENFYAQNGGDLLVLHENYPPLIRDFLEKEDNLIEHTISERGYETLVEIGCMDARLLDRAKKSRVSYFGVDLVERYISEAKNKISNQWDSRIGTASVLCASAYDFTPDNFPAIKSFKKPIFVFPFNSFGNMDEPQKAIDAMLKCGTDFLISTYLVDSTATETREEYYRNCGYSNITVDISPEGTRFTSREGLDTFAPSQEFLLSLVKNNFKISVHNFGKIGVGYQGSLL